LHGIYSIQSYVLISSHQKEYSTISWSNISGALFDDFKSDEFVVSTISSRLLPLVVCSWICTIEFASIWTNTFHPNSSDQNYIYHGSPIKLGRCSKRKPDYTTKLRKPTNEQTTNTYSDSKVLCQSVTTISWSNISGALFDDFKSDEFVVSTISSRVLPLVVCSWICTIEYAVTTSITSLCISLSCVSFLISSHQKEYLSLYTTTSSW
jgi:hypothetical protein